MSHHLQLLKEGTATWNQWRERHPLVKPNLRGAYLKGQDLRGANLSEADLRSANFRGANLQNANLTSARAGLQKRWLVLQLAVALVTSVVAGFLNWVPGIFLAIIISTGSNTTLTQQLSYGIFSAIVLIATTIAIITQGLTIRAVGTILVVVAATVIAVVTVVVAEAITVTKVIIGEGVAGSAVVIVAAVSVTAAIAAAVTITGEIAAVVGAIAGVIAVPVVGAISGTVAVTVAILAAGVGAVTVAMTIAVLMVLLSLYVAWKALKEDPKYAIVRQFALFFASLGGTNFHKADLTDADFSRATLKSANFHKAILTRTCWKDAKQLNRARVGDSILADTAIRQLLVTGDGYDRSFEATNLRGANLAGANLERANLKRADISEATLSDANLKDANLTEVAAVGTNFSRAYLTGACLEAWNIDTTTVLDNVDCQYVFLLENYNANGSRERRPHDPEKVFAPGDFQKLFQDTRNFVELLIRNGLEPGAFQEAFQKLMDEYDVTPADIQSIEKKGDDVLMKVEVPEGTDKATFEASFDATYQVRLEERAKAAELRAADTNQKYADLKEIALQLASQSPQQVLNYHNENNAMSNAPKYDQRGANFSGGFADTNYGKMVENQHNYAPERNLAESAAEIQQLLQILDRSYPEDLPADTQAEIDVAVKGISKDPVLKDRVIAALKAGGMTALEELTDSPYVKILLSAYKGWQEPVE